MKEIFDKKRMSLKDANISSSSEDEQSEKLPIVEDYETSDIDEDNFFSIQRKILKKDHNPELLKKLIIQNKSIKHDDAYNNRSAMMARNRNQLSDQMTLTEDENVDQSSFSEFSNLPLWHMNEEYRDRELDIPTSPMSGNGQKFTQFSRLIQVNKSNKVEKEEDIHLPDLLTDIKVEHRSTMKEDRPMLIDLD
jgi:hypothetical protein